MTSDTLVPAPQSQTINLPAGHFHYLSWNADQETLPAIVLVHGITSSAQSWVRVGAALADRYRVYAFDMRGHGDSIKPAPGVYSLRDTANDVADFIEMLSLQEPVLLGHSWGGATALVLASETVEQRPTLNFSRIILEDPAHNFGNGDPVKRAANFTSDIGRPEAELRADLIERNPAWSIEDIDAKIDASSKVSYEAVVSVFDQAGKEGELLPLLSRLKVPTLLIRADPAQGTTLDDQAWAEAQRLLPAGNVAVQIPGATHNIHRNKFTAFMQTIDTFLP